MEGLRNRVFAGLVVAIAAASAAGPASARRKQPPPGPKVKTILTTAGLSKALTPMPDRRFGRPARTSASMPAGRLDRPARTSAPVIAVNDGRRYQRVTGFGAAMTDTSAWLIHDQLPPAAGAALIKQLFGASGIRLDYLRVPMGASDFTVLGRPYSYDDLPPGQSDPQLDRFSVAHDYAYILPTLVQVMGANDATRIIAAPWSPPAWMKTNDDLGNPHDDGSLLPFAYPVLARYFVKFVQAYVAWGIPISAVTPQNEPQAGALYAGLNLSEPQEAYLISRFLAPALRAAHLHTAIYGLDRGADLEYAQALLQSDARRYLAGIAWHCYGGMQTMSALHILEPAVDQVVSECAPGIVPYPPTEVAISALRNWASAVALWNVALDPAGGPVEEPNSACTGCTGLATISEQTHTATLGLDYYQLGQFSKFIGRGAVRIDATRLVRDFRTSRGVYGVTPGLDDVAFLNPDRSHVLVVYDNSRARRSFAVQWRGRMFTYSLSPGATATFTWRGAPRRRAPAGAPGPGGCGGGFPCRPAAPPGRAAARPADP